MPPHTPREAVIAATAQARAAKADLIVTVGGGSITDGAKAVQICLANDVSTVDGIEAVRARRGRAPAMTAPTVRQISVPTTIAGGEFSATAGVTNQRSRVKEMLRHELTIPRAVILDPRHHGAHAAVAVAFDRHPRRRSLRRSSLLARGTSLRRRAGAEGAVDADPGAAARAGPIRTISTPGWIASSAPGSRWALRRPAFRWAPAMASAMCSAPCSTCRMVIPPA